MPHLSISLLGPIEITLDGEPISGFDSDKVRALLAYLAVEADRPHRRESLAGLLWPDWPERSARKNLSNALYHLRQVIRDAEATPPFFLIDREAIQFSRESEHTLDVAVFQAVAAGESAEGWQEAMALYRGPFLEGFSLADSAPFEDWALLVRERLAIGALERTAEHLEEGGEVGRALEVARRQLEMAPWDEEGHRRVMRLLAQSGQRAAAWRQYEACRQALARELGVEPSEQTQLLAERLLEGKAATDRTVVEAGPERTRRKVGACPYRGLAAFREADAPFFHGREAFTERLVEAVHTKPLVAVVVGSSGSGKSSAVYAGLLPRLREEGEWEIVDFRPGGEPFRALAAALMPTLEPDLAATDRLIQTGKLALALEEEEVTLIEIVEQALAQGEGRERLLLLADQFEELYTLCPQPETRRRLLDALLTAAEGAGQGRPSPLVVLLTMRADFMGQALTHRPFVEVLQEGTLMLGPMTREELQAAIEKPAEGQGATIEAGLVERLLDDVGQEPGNLPLLEFALTLLWEQLEEGCMTHAAYEGIGRVEGALARYAEEAYAELGAEEQAGARRVFVQLVQPGEETGDTRRVATRADLGEENFPPGPALGGPAAGGHRAGPHHRQRAGGGGARSADPALGTAADLDGRGPPLSDVAGAATGRTSSSTPR